MAMVNGDGGDGGDDEDEEARSVEYVNVMGSKIAAGA